MAEEIRSSRFRYVDADDLDRTTVDFSDLDVRNAEGDKLGNVEGFIVDGMSRRPYYVVVQSGGWFLGGRYLVPVNHSRLEREQDEDVLRVDLNKDTIRNFPRFDKDEFDRLSETQLRDFENQIGRACCPEEAASRTTTWSHDSWRHYREPAWWRSAADVDAVARSSRPAPPPVERPAAGRVEPERIVAQDSQPVGNRAEPGNVLGIESGGQETHIGDTARDERRRVEVADRETRQAEIKNRG